MRKVAAFTPARWARLAESELVAVCDAQGERRAGFAARYGGRAFDDPCAMLAQAGVEAVSICTPHPLHRDPAVLAARAGSPRSGREASGRRASRLRRP